LTTSRTWQSGAVEFLYLRRELIGELAAKPYSPDLQASFEKRLDQIDLLRAGRWVDRTSATYKGTGLYSTPALQTIIPTYRSFAQNLLERFLCTKFGSVHVDSITLLRAVGNDSKAIRSLDIGNSPMRQRVGCKNCHIPLDSMAALFGELKTPLFGSYPSGLATKGQLYITGPDDFRGDVAGTAGLGQLLATQPEFNSCAVEHAFRSLTRRQIRSFERPKIEAWAREFASQRQSVEWLYRTILMDASYSGAGQP
jgi:hypothetical protein